MIEQVSEETLSNGGIDSPTATANGPAVQPVSAKKSATKAQSQQAQPADGEQVKVNEDPEKKAKKVRRCNGL